jgi:hypothetical protein
VFTGLEKDVNRCVFTGLEKDVSRCAFTGPRLRKGHVPRITTRQLRTDRVTDRQTWEGIMDECGWPGEANMHLTLAFGRV